MFEAAEDASQSFVEVLWFFLGVCGASLDFSAFHSDQSSPEPFWEHLVVSPSQRKASFLRKSFSQYISDADCVFIGNVKLGQFRLLVLLLPESFTWV